MVRGTVQGVGFRPYVHALATRLSLGGFVRNETDGVRIEVEGANDLLDEFIAALTRDPPPLATIDAIHCEHRPHAGTSTFVIEASAASAGPIRMTPDVATCEACLHELFDPDDRRHRYAFINCTACGPRHTIVTGAPYDRARTTMAAFKMCAACQAEYDDPADRRFHAQPNACPVCGPRLAIVDRVVADPIAVAASALRAGQIVALKGLGGFHLACDASDRDAVATLRARKHRDEKPFAVMVETLAAAERLCELGPEEVAVLTSRERPIVLVRRRPGGPLVEELAPRNPLVGIMLPYTPLHHLLLRELAGLPLVMTSGNRCDEPIAYTDEDARDRLRDIADLMLVHDRPIQTRCDDSLVRVVAGEPLPLRRARGYTPRTIRLPIACRQPILALGGHLKATFALGREDRALLGHHIGDLDDHRAYTSYVTAIADYERTFEFAPELLVHDLHPDYGSTRYAAARSLPALAVQHHHAHIASCMAEHGLHERVIGVAFDGGGYGSDGRVWGGEILLADLHAFERAAHLRYVALPGGEQAIREPWRMALSYLVEADRVEHAEQLLAEVPAGVRRAVLTMIERGLHSPATSSSGRLFDAVAALAGVRDRTSFEGQGAMELEWQAMTEADGPGYTFAYRDGLIDARPVIQELVADRLAGRSAATIARRFHTALVDVVARACRHLREQTGVTRVVLAGGVFQNAILSTELSARLASSGFTVHRHREVPPNDGGLALGQLAIAAARGLS